MKEAYEIRAEARKTFKNNWGKAIAMCLLPLVYYVVIALSLIIIIAIVGMIIAIVADSEQAGEIYIGGTIQVVYFILAFLLSFLLLGVRFKFIDWTKKHDLEFSASKSVFNIFNYNLWMIFKIALWEGLFTFLWSLLFVIPGLIKGFSYSQAFNLYKTSVDNGTADQYRAIDYITQSKKLMNGYKFKLFYLQLTFIGWEILAAFTMGIGQLWLIPYMMGSQAVFYNELLEHNESALTDK